MMLAKKIVIRAGTGLFCLIASLSDMQCVYAQQEMTGLDADELGQTIEMTTRLRSFVGKPIWTFIIRDVDQGKTFPYVVDIQRGGNHWVLFTHSRNYLITASSLQIETYQSRCNRYKNFRIKNFCNLESDGRIIRGRSLYITIEGDLSPNPNTYACHVTSYPTTHFYTYKPGKCSEF